MPGPRWRPWLDPTTADPRSETLADRALQDAQGGPQGGVRHDRESVLVVVAHLGPVVERGHIGDPVLTGLQAVAVEVRNRDIGSEVPGDLPVTLEVDDVHR